MATTSIVGTAFCLVESASISLLVLLKSTYVTSKSLVEHVATVWNDWKRIREASSRPYSYGRKRSGRSSFLNLAMGKGERTEKEEIEVGIDCHASAPIDSAELDKFVEHMVPSDGTSSPSLPFMTLVELIAHEKNFDVKDYTEEAAPTIYYTNSGPVKTHWTTGVTMPSYFETDPSGTRRALWEKISQRVSLPVGFFYARCKGEALKETDTSPGIMLPDLWMPEFYEMMSVTWKAENVDDPNNKKGLTAPPGSRWRKLATKPGEPEETRMKRAVALPKVPFSYHLVVIDLPDTEKARQAQLKLEYEEAKKTNRQKGLLPPPRPDDLLKMPRRDSQSCKTTFKWSTMEREKASRATFNSA